MPAGRPRAFDIEKALDRAMQVFWRKGYEGASLTDLTSAMGISSPSLYAAFGSKEELFLKAVDRYQNGPGGYGSKALRAPTAGEVVEQLFRGAVEANTNQRNPGCLLVQGALVSSDGAAQMRRDLASRREAGVADVRSRFERARLEGDLPAESDPDALARYVAAVIFGLAVEAAGGASRKDLEKMVDVALEGWRAAYAGRKPAPKREKKNQRSSRERHATRDS